MYILERVHHRADPTTVVYRCIFLFFLDWFVWRMDERMGGWMLSHGAYEERTP